MDIPPSSMRMADYESIWRPEGWNMIFIGPTATWRQEWGIWEAIRDIVQNCLDETENYRSRRTAEGLEISDKGKGLGVADFLLGPPKAKESWARGRFGEGMKIASLALLREGYKVHVQTVGRELWIVFIEQLVNGQVQSLAALWRPDGTRTGTVFTIVGYTGADYADRFTSNLPRSAIVWETPSQTKLPPGVPDIITTTRATVPMQRLGYRMNHIINYDFSPFGSRSRIFARDIYMRELDSMFSYNLWGFEMAPDRHGPRNEGDMWVDIARTWSGVTNVNLLKDLFKIMADPPLLQCNGHTCDENIGVSFDPHMLGYCHALGKDYRDIAMDNKDSWETAWHAVFGRKAVLETSASLRPSIVHLGHEPTRVSYRIQYFLQNLRLVPTDVDIVQETAERLQGIEVIPEHQLEATERNHLEFARALARQVGHTYTPSFKGYVTGVYAAIIPQLTAISVGGTYDKATHEVHVSVPTLRTMNRTLDTLIHEIAHHTSQAEDGEAGHNNALSSVGAEVAMEIASGAYDEHIRSAKWW